MISIGTAVAKSAHQITGPKRLLVALLAGTAMTLSASPASAQDADAPAVEAEDDDVIVVSGILSSLKTALNEKRQADSLVEIIQAEAIGKLPDQNLAEVLENITGIQITREAGVGTGVQIRGSNDNRTEINGVGTVGSGSGRSGINFEDVNAAIISSVEVIKAPTAMTTEGSVGGTINLRTIRPLDLRDPLIAARVQGEYSELSKSIQPRISASFGNNWAVGDGEVGIVLSGSYAKQDALSFRPRVDRDTLTAQGTGVTATGAPGPAFDYLGIQFLNQELEDFKYETYNLAGTLEYAPTDSLKFYFDGFYNKQTRKQESTRIQASGVSNVQRTNVPDTFETVDFGSLGGVDLGSIQAAETGTLQPTVANKPNLRFSSDVGARLTDSNLLRLGTEWESGRFKARVEASRSLSSTRTPDLSTTLNFINPNTPLTGATLPNDNGTPFAYDLSGGTLAFGIDTSSAVAPTIAQLLDPSNVVLDAVSVGNNTTRNVEYVGRMDFSLALDDLTGFLTSFDWGYRYNDTSTEFNEFTSSIGLSALRDSPNGTVFSELLVAGPSIFGRADGRSLFFGDFLIIDPNLAYSDQAGTLATLQAALAGEPGGRRLADPSFEPASFYKITETSHAVYGQLNFAAGIFSGNAGLRYVDTIVNSLGNNIGAGGTITQVTTPGKYQVLLPRLNLAANLTDDIVARASYGQDINRPNFNDLKTSVRFTSGPNTAVVIGNPDLAPEKVTSYDASLSYYFAPAAVFSVGVFHKRRTNLFVTQEFAPAVEPVTGFKDFTPPCEGGGIFNPIADRNVFVDPANAGNGLCVPVTTTINDPGVTKQTGVEVAFQYDLSSFEDSIGFASGFGLAANYTYQKFSGGEATNSSAADSRANAIFNSSSGLNSAPYTAVQGLLDFSPHAYNITLFYEKYGLSARARYTWRDAFRTNDTAGGATLGSTLGFPVVTSARGQLNGGITYDLTDNINIGVEGVNLTKSEIKQYCVNDGALLCFQGLPDRRLTFGASIRF
ncbi:TonB-dependent receptor [Allopontixanthobacter sediminis]|uniref:TonB-dependent receptor n=1 Tax=Allopontixanthobacter sediminis TaxID=1689985 RepID=A0A845B3J8_9SPHN|nr:TonB-dependent receptor [Allopontixanthobacter sediminis]MXP43997.1 TonB-dependent receptor [Allopontixanthobacter sediminis]